MRDRTLCGEMARILAHWPARETRAWPEARDRRRRPVNCERGRGPGRAFGGTPAGCRGGNTTVVAVVVRMGAGWSGGGAPDAVSG
jgi:hypothetical protein